MQRKNIKCYDYKQSPLYNLQSKKKLAKVLCITDKQLKRLASSDKKYLEKNILDKKGKTRHVEKASYRLGIVHKRIENLLNRIKKHDFIYSPSKGKSHVDNAILHCGNACMMKLDLKKYFPSTASKRVFWFFNSRMKCSLDVAGVLTSLLTYNGYLPTGSCHSTVLSYFANIQMWESIGKIASNANCVLSVWVDDITVSGNTISERTKTLIKQAIKKHGLKYHKEKHYKEGDAKEVTGIILLDDQIKVPNRHHLKRHNLKTLIQKQTHCENKIILLSKFEGLEVYINRIINVDRELKTTHK